MQDRIKQLEQMAQALEPDAAERALLRDKVFRYAEEFLEAIEQVPAFCVADDQGVGLYDSPISEDPIDIDAALSLLQYNVDRPGVNAGSGGHLAYIPGSGL